MAKRLALLTVGTRGDVQPIAALGLALKDEGYDIVLAAPENFEGFVTDLGLEFARCGSDFQSLMHDPEMAYLLSANPFHKMKEKKEYGTKMFQEVIHDTAKACKGADAILFTMLTGFACDIAEAQKIPAVMLGLQPFMKTKAHPIPSIIPDLGGPLNRLTYEIIYLSALIHRSTFNKGRVETLGIKKKPHFSRPLHVRGEHVPVIYGYSGSVNPRPDDWGDHIDVTGYWFFGPERGLGSSARFTRVSGCWGAADLYWFWKHADP